MEKTYDELLEFHDHYEDKIWELNNNLEKLQGEYDDLEDDKEELEEKVEELGNDRDILKIKHDDLESELEELRFKYEKYSEMEGLEINGLNDSLKLTILIKAFKKYTVQELEQRLNLDFINI